MTIRLKGVPFFYNFLQCLLYFTVRLPNLDVRLSALANTLTEKFVGENKVDLDPVFSKLFDEDYDERFAGVTRAGFVRVYSEWVRYCLRRSPENSVRTDLQNMLNRNRVCYVLLDFIQ